MIYHRSSSLCWGTANGPKALATLGETDDASLLARRGQLLLLSTADVDEHLLRQVHDAYYGHTSFDVLPSLWRAFQHATDTPAQGMLSLALVIEGLRVFAIGTGQTHLWLVRETGTRELLAREGRSVHEVSPDCAGECPEDYVCGLWHLSYGDTLVAAPRTIARLGANKIARIARAGSRADAQARSLARAVGGASPAPVLVAHMPGFTPVPDLGPIRGWPAPRPERAAARPSHAASPIRVALIVAAVAVGVSLWVAKPDLSADNLTRLLTWMLSQTPTAAAEPTSAPTATPGRASLAVPPTATPEPTRPRQSAPRAGDAASVTQAPGEGDAARQYPAPVLLGPKEGDTVHSPELRLTWSWEGELGDGEFFDVRLWRLGTTERSIAWTRDHAYVERLPSDGWHSWTVVPVRGKEGVIEKELSARPPAINMQWHPGAGGGSSGSEPETPAPAPTPTPRTTPVPPTPVPPTRVTPATRPTRVTPGAESQGGLTSLTGAERRTS